MRCAASELPSASLRTSEATTAKPRPCSPARAASMAAFSARRLVCPATARIVSEIDPISWPRSRSAVTSRERSSRRDAPFCTRLTMSSTSPPPLRAQQRVAGELVGARELRRHTPAGLADGGERRRHLLKLRRLAPRPSLTACTGGGGLVAGLAHGVGDVGHFTGERHHLFGVGARAHVRARAARQQPLCACRPQELGFLAALHSRPPGRSVHSTAPPPERPGGPDGAERSAPVARSRGIQGLAPAFPHRRPRFRRAAAPRPLRRPPTAPRPAAGTRRGARRTPRRRSRRRRTPAAGRRRRGGSSLPPRRAQPLQQPPGKVARAAFRTFAW
jgi:hypothetical protein